MLEPIIKVLLLAAAADGVIDERERDRIISILTTYTSGRISMGDINTIQNSLIQDVRQHKFSLNNYIKNICDKMDQAERDQVYALSFEICLANDELEIEEIEFLKTLEECARISQEVSRAVKLSANLRHPILTVE